MRSSDGSPISSSFMAPLKCPVCGGECITDAEFLIREAASRFSPCSDCISISLDKRLPPPGFSPPEPCPSCGKRFIDDVFSHCHMIMAGEGVIGEDTPLGGIGMPLVSPGFDMISPPFLPEKSLVFLTRHADKRTAERLVEKVPEIKGVIRDSGNVPGISGADFSSTNVNELLAGCDVRADIFRTSRGPFAVYKQQSLLHIEFPRGAAPKIGAVESMIESKQPDVFIDACSGAGTLGIAAMVAGVPVVVFNDAWYPAAFWSAVNLHVNRAITGSGETPLPVLSPPGGSMVSAEPVKIAASKGSTHEAVVIWGDYMEAGDFVPEGGRLAAIDVFGKDGRENLPAIITSWKTAYGGDAFIP